MKAITLYQPWASAIAWGLKTIETRSWHPYYRGDLAIHAGQSMPPEAKNLLTWLGPALTRAGMKDVEFPRGVIVAVCQIEWVRPADEVSSKLGPMEYSLGDYSMGRFAWKLSNVRRLETPLRVSGMQKLWAVSREFERQVLDNALVRV